jgi:hypothetical protein
MMHLKESLVREGHEANDSAAGESRKAVTLDTTDSSIDPAPKGNALAQPQLLGSAKAFLFVLPDF